VGTTANEGAATRKVAPVSRKAAYVPAETTWVATKPAGMTAAEATRATAEPAASHVPATTSMEATAATGVSATATATTAAMSTTTTAAAVLSEGRRSHRE
jgi:hypothetical protein